MTSETALLDQPITHLTFTSTHHESMNFNGFSGKNLVIYFYPKDSTPGCTQESKDFRDAYPQFVALNTEILGISRDSLKSHESFQNKHQLPFPLISDPNETLCHYFAVIKWRNFYGIKSLGIERSTFLIDVQGILRREWRKVKVAGHSAEVLAAVQQLTKN